MCFCRLTRGHCPHNDAVSTFSPCFGSASRSPPFTRRGFPRVFVSFSVFLRLVALSFFFWVGGVPLAVFSLSPPLLALLSSGWVGSPCRVFPVFSPWFSGGWGVVFCVFVSPAISCILRLSSLATRTTWSTDPQTPRPPRPFPWCVGPDPSPAGSRRSDAPGLRAGGVTGGFVTPHTS